jgi:hypothetical protein
VLARDGDRTVITMVSDYQGAPKEFAVVVPVPTFIQKSQIHIGDKAIVDHLDAFSAPRLVEYHDPDPCPDGLHVRGGRSTETGFMSVAPKFIEEIGVRAGVTVEAKYTVGEYDILILSATESTALQRWLESRGYKIPAGAAPILASYMKQGMRFFVARVNLKEQERLGVQKLRPIQVAFESPKFVLPIRLGTVNAKGPQELFVYTLTRQGRVEAVNYRTIKLPSDMDIPVYVKEKFPEFYRATFGHQVAKENMSAVFTEYAWDVSSCDPCASPPLSAHELRQLGVFWLDEAGTAGTFVTRLHVRYDRAHFPEDLVLQQTSDRTNFQGRYVLRHPFKGDCDCPAGREYVAKLRDRRKQEAKNLSQLTGWSVESIRGQMAVNAEWAAPGEDLKPVSWWERIWE